MVNKTEIQKKKVNSEALVRVAIYLAGVKAGQGNLNPLGTQTLDDLWDIIRFLRGDERYESDLS